MMRSLYSSLAACERPGFKRRLLYFHVLGPRWGVILGLGTILPKVFGSLLRKRITLWKNDRSMPVFTCTLQSMSNGFLSFSKALWYNQLDRSKCRYRISLTLLDFIVRKSGEGGTEPTCCVPRLNYSRHHLDSTVINQTADHRFYLSASDILP